MPDLTLDKMTMNSDPDLFNNTNRYFTVKDASASEGEYVIWEIKDGPVYNNWIQILVETDTATSGSDFGDWTGSFDGGNTWDAQKHYGNSIYPQSSLHESLFVRVPTYNDSTYEGNESFTRRIRTNDSEITTKGYIIDDADFDMKDFNVNNIDDAQNTINAADGAIRYLDQERSKVAATQNKLEHNLNSLTENQTNIETAKGKILDTDLANETSKYTLHTMLQNASSTVLSKAKNSPANRLQLLDQLR
ncbi:flagellin [Veronia nyctiphanis]